MSDFGLARYIPGLKEGKTYIKGQCGTHNYMAPEVIADQHYGLKADMYSLGVSAYEMYTGELPTKESLNTKG